MVELFHILNIDSALLRRERERILQLLNNLLSFGAVVEVGSTAVEGVIGKEDIDFLVRVPCDRFGEARNILDQHFERNERQLADSEFQGYRVASPIDVSVQLTIENGRYDDFEPFLLQLRSDPALRRAYNDLKLAWNGRPMEEYRAAKSDFIAAALASYHRGARSD